MSLFKNIFLIFITSLFSGCFSVKQPSYNSSYQHNDSFPTVGLQVNDYRKSSKVGSIGLSVYSTRELATLFSQILRDDFLAYSKLNTLLGNYHDTTPLTLNVDLVTLSFFSFDAGMDDIDGKVQVNAQVRDLDNKVIFAQTYFATSKIEKKFNSIFSNWNRSSQTRIIEDLLRKISYKISHDLRLNRTLGGELNY